MANFLVDYEDSRRTQALGLDAMPTTWGQGARAVMGATWATSPTPSMRRMAERESYEDLTYTRQGIEYIRPGKIAKTLSAEEANWRYSVKGHLQFDHDVPEPVARELRELKLEELQRQDVLRRSEVGMGTTLTVGLLTSLADPLNIASAFIPVVGQARYAALARSMGPNAARAVVGAAEGAIGAAVLEPLVYINATQEQADYDMSDSMANILFGGVMGAGLHMGVGYVGDRYQARLEASSLQREVDDLPAETQTALLQTAESQILNGRPVDVSPVADAVLPSRLADKLREEPLGRAQGESIFDFERRKALIESVDPEAVKLMDDIRTETEQLRYWMDAYQRATTETGPADAAVARIETLQRQLDELGPNADFRQIRDLQTEIDLLTEEFSSPTRPMKQALAEHAQRGKKSAAMTRKIQRRIDYLQGKLPELNRRVSDAYRVGQQMLAQSPAGRKLVERAKAQSEPYYAPEDIQNSENFAKMADAERGAPKDLDAEIQQVEAELADLQEFVDLGEFETAEIRNITEKADVEARAVVRAAGCRLGRS